MKSRIHSLKFFSALAVLILLLAPVCLLSLNSAAESRQGLPRTPLSTAPPATPPPPASPPAPAPIAPPQFDPTQANAAQSNAYQSPNATTTKAVSTASIMQQMVEQSHNLPPDASDQADLSHELAYGAALPTAGPPDWTEQGIQWFFDLGMQIDEAIIPGTVGFLVNVLKEFVLNPNIAINGVGMKDTDFGKLIVSISPPIQKIAQTMWFISADLMLLLFILSIWRYWIEAAWRGGGNHFAPIARLIFTAGLIMVWPYIYAYEVELTNEMIHAIFFRPDEIPQLINAITLTLKGVNIAMSGLLLMAVSGIAGKIAALPIATFGPVVGGIIGFIGGLMFFIPGVIIILELVAIVVLKSVQTAILIAQYMFAPVFLVFFASPDTEKIAKTFVKSFIEVSMWTFVWVGLLRILVTVMNAYINQHQGSYMAAILLVIGVLQLMLAAPEFMGRAHISPVSELLTAGLLIKGLSKSAQSIGGTLNDAAHSFAKLAQMGVPADGIRDSEHEMDGNLKVLPKVNQALGAMPSPKSPSSLGPTQPPGTPLAPSSVPPRKPAGSPPGSPTGSPSGSPLGSPPTAPMGSFSGSSSGSFSGSPPGSSSGSFSGSFSGSSSGSSSGSPSGSSSGSTLGHFTPLPGLVGATDDQPSQPLAKPAWYPFALRNNFGGLLRFFGTREHFTLNTVQSVRDDNKTSIHFDPSVRNDNGATEIEGPRPPKQETGESNEDFGKRVYENDKQWAALRLLTATSNHVGKSSQGIQARYDAAKARGGLMPRTLSEVFLAAALRSEGKRFADTPLVRQRMAKMMHEEGVGGTRAYLDGEQGNAVTEYLRGAMGENRKGKGGWEDEAAGIREGDVFEANLAKVLSDEANPRHVNSGINPRTERNVGLVRSARLEQSPENRSIIDNESVAALTHQFVQPAANTIHGLGNHLAAEHHAKRDQDDRAAGRPILKGAARIQDVQNNVWYSTIRNLTNPQVQAAVAFGLANRPCTSLKQLDDLAAVGHAMGNNPRDYTTALEASDYLTKSLGGASIAPENGGSVSGLLTNLINRGLNVKDADTLDMAADNVKAGNVIDPARASAMFASRKANNGATSGTITEMAAVASSISGNNPTARHYDEAVEIVQASDAVASMIGSSADKGVITPIMMGLQAGNANIGDQQIRTVVAKMIMNHPDPSALRDDLKRNDLVKEVSMVARSISNDKPTSEHYKQAVEIVQAKEVSMLARSISDNNPTTDHYKEAIEIVQASDAVAGAVGTSADKAVITPIMMGLQAGGVNTRNQQVRTVVTEMIMNHSNPPALQNDLERKNLVKAVVLANDTMVRDPAYLTSKHVEIAQRVIVLGRDEAQHLYNNNQYTDHLGSLAGMDLNTADYYHGCAVHAAENYYHLRKSRRP